LNTREKNRLYSQEYYKKNKDRVLVRKAANLLRIKGQWAKYLGGKCQDCGIDYTNKCSVIFDFHHRDPAIKSFSLSRVMLFRPFEEVKAEADKTDLLCSNCHRLRHAHGEDSMSLERELTNE